ncbi:HVA22 domain membrane protein [Histoplasma capsulatum G186AR]|uniref:Protein YOP1 n=2 Tax=Ajellomyces capsulatus TaxID=5037 RepID=C0NX72_AJECG|nr:HVA22 domain membrane protein [Histoplasma capsulatum G186AR]EEH03938.1 HVA22 domain membrane protein [Histoplasma capsulatum G186AR]KAG5295545.1 HVA22 domain membrane protein [Histoplasma capsulatum]QSS73526.1 HVA22 domain membrane protein [Histoplasma capsulatum G186AR]
MFGIVADLLSSVLTILFPIFASYKALRSSDPSQLAPWLMYWVVMSIVLLVESWTYFIIGWFPFYSWIRLFALSYLVLPQTQGAKMLYREYIDPFLCRHERDIEHFISKTHDSAKSAGLEYLYKAINLLRERVLGLPPMAATAAPSPHPPQAAGAAGFAQSLLSRFTIPGTAGAASSLASPAADLYSLLAAAVGSATSSGKSRDVQAEELSASGKLIPDSIATASKAEQAEYIASQKERLGVLLSAFDREQRNLRLDPRDAAGAFGGGGGSSDQDDLAYGSGGYDEYGGAGLRKNRSDVSFENIEHEDLLSGSRESRRHSRSPHRRRGGDAVDFAQRSVEEIARASGIYR